MADVLTKYVDRKTMQEALQRMGRVKTEGRAARAPAAVGA